MNAQFFRSLLGIRLALWLFALHIAVVLPARMGLSYYRESFGKSYFVDLLVGTSVDTRFSYPFFALVLAFSYFLWRQLRQRFPENKRVTITSNIVFLGFPIFFSLLLTLGNIAATEFKIQRGIYPVIYDVFLGLSDQSFIKANIPTFFMNRYRFGLIISLFLQGFIFWRLWLLCAKENGKKRWQESISFVLVILIVSLAFFELYVKSNRLFASIQSHDEIKSPVKSFYDSFANEDAIKPKLQYFYLEEQWTEQDIVNAAPLFGFATEQGRDLYARESAVGTCDKHPLTRPLVEDGNELSQLLRQLSRIIFEKQKEPVQIRHLILESFRANEVHALNSHAPEVLTPFTNRLYAKAREQKGIAAFAMQQAGIRTSQGISATFCGLGGLPLGASLTRDFGNVPMRCLSDVLNDAGFAPRLFYGSQLSFDNMLDFFFSHGMVTYDDHHLPPNMPQAVWGVADHAVMRFAWNELDRLPKDYSNYAAFLTLSNHGPYTVPEDMPKDVQDQVAGWLDQNRPDVQGEDRNHLFTTAYTDRLIEETVTHMESNGNQGILIVHADHASGDNPLWQKIAGQGSESWQRQIPFTVYFTEKLLAILQRDVRFEETVKRINGILTQPSSLNDVPKMVLALLSEHPQMKHMPREWQWHTLGGQITSNDFKVAPAPHTRVWGIDARNVAFFLTETGEVAAEEPVDFHQKKTDPAWPTRHLRGGAHFMGSFISGFKTKCPDLSLVRRNWQTGSAPQSQN